MPDFSAGNLEIQANYVTDGRRFVGTDEQAPQPHCNNSRNNTFSDGLPSYLHVVLQSDARVAALFGEGHPLGAWRITSAAERIRFFGCPIGHPQSAGL